MSSSTPVRHAWRVLIGLLAITAVLFGINSLGVYVFKASSWAPELALDLQGGTQIILSAQTEDGAAPTQEQLDQAAAIIRQRIDASGVSEADVATEGGQNIVVGIPGVADEETRQRIEASAKLEFRPVLQAAYATVSATPTPTPTPDAATETDTEATPEPTAESAATAAPTTESAATASPAPSSEPTATPEPATETTGDASTAGATDIAWLTDELLAELDSYTCTTDAADDNRSAPSDQPLIACDEAGTLKYILGPVPQEGDPVVELDGTVINDASSGRNENGVWAVNLRLNDAGTKMFGEISQILYQNNLSGLSPRDQFAFVLDGAVISAPVMQGVILNGQPSITGSFNQESAQALADQLKYGALPLSFEVQSSDAISATLGSQQLQIGLIAGLIGLGLVAVYSLLSYRALGWVIMASIVVMAVLTYIIICILAWRMGFRLSLAGVAGLIVSIGFTADSFIVYFERIRDELRDGKSITGAVEDGWGRAKRTIYISKSINILAAVVLYIMADSTVKGFAFTLGLTTLIDVFIFVIFTHPVMQLLARTKFFGGGHRLSGLDPKALGAVHEERIQYREVQVAATGRAAKNARSQHEAERRQTIAERKRAEAQEKAGTAGEQGER